MHPIGKGMTDCWITQLLLQVCSSRKIKLVGSTSGIARNYIKGGQEYSMNSLLFYVHKKIELSLYTINVSFITSLY